MTVDIDNQKMMVVLWVPRKEREDPIVQKKIDELSKEFKAKKYTVAVFLSGDKDILEQTSALLCYNQRRMAQLAGRER